MLVPMSEQGIGLPSTLTVDSSRPPDTDPPASPLGVTECSGKWIGPKIEWVGAERSAGDIEMGMSGEQIFHHSHSALMLSPGLACSSMLD